MWPRDQPFLDGGKRHSASSRSRSDNDGAAEGHLVRGQPTQMFARLADPFAAEPIQGAKPAPDRILATGGVHHGKEADTLALGPRFLIRVSDSGQVLNRIAVNKPT